MRPAASSVASDRSLLDRVAARSRRSTGVARFVVVSGLTGAGKTEFLAELRGAGEQVLDLEALASHRGSAFGAIGLPAQPSHATFGRTVEQHVASADPGRDLWVEDEGPFIGSVGVPAWLVGEIATAPVVVVDVPSRRRVERLYSTYGAASEPELIDALGRCRRRLGHPLADEACARVGEGDVRGAIEVVLPWFDAAYGRRIAAYGPREVMATVEGRLDVAVR